MPLALALLVVLAHAPDSAAPAPVASAEGASGERSSGTSPDSSRAPSSTTSSSAGTPIAEHAGAVTLEADPPAERPRLFVVDPAVVKMPDAVKKTVSAAIAEAAANEGLEVLTKDDARELLTRSSELALLGSDADGLSLSALGKAVGARHLIAAVVSEVDGTTVVQMRLIDSETTSVVVRREARAEDYDGNVLETVRSATRLVLAPLFAHMAGTVTLSVSEEGANVLLDGQQIGTTPVEPFSVPGGYHTLTVTKEGFIRHQETFRVEQGTALSRELVLRPSVEFLERYRADAELYRTLAWVGTGATTALTGVSVGLGIGWYLGANAVADLIDERDATVAGQKLNPNVPAHKAIIDDYDQRIGEQGRTAQLYSIAGFAVGAVAVATCFTAGYFWIFGDDPNRYAEFEVAAE